MTSMTTFIPLINNACIAIAKPAIINVTPANRLLLRQISSLLNPIFDSPFVIFISNLVFDKVKINSNDKCIPHILNISLENVRPETFIHAMEDDEIYLSTNTACSSGDLSTAVMAIFNDKSRAVSTVRISLSYVTTNEEINKFLTIFKMKYNQLSSLMKEN